MSFYQTAGTVNENGDQTIILHLRKDSGEERWIVLGVLKGWKSVVDGRKVKRKVTPFKTLTWNIIEVMWSDCFGIKQSKKGGYSRASVQKPSLEKMNAHLRVQWVKAHRGAALQRHVGTKWRSSQLSHPWQYFGVLARAGQLKKCYRPECLRRFILSCNEIPRSYF